MRKLLIALSIISIIAGCASPGMSGGTQYNNGRYDANDTYLSD
jgi:type II secretory pathway pseudopilin PulG